MVMTDNIVNLNYFGQDNGDMQLSYRPMPKLVQSDVIFKNIIFSCEF